MAKRGRKKKKTVNINVAVTIMIIASIVFAVLIYFNSGFIGENLSPLLGGIMGYVKYLLPIGIFVMALYIAYQGESNWTKKIIQFSLVLLCISIIMNTSQIIKGNIVTQDREFQDIVMQSYHLGERSIGGGAVGCVFAILLINLIGRAATIILSIGVIIGLVIVMFGIDVVNNISALIEASNKRKERIAKAVSNKHEKVESVHKETSKERRLREQAEREQAV